MAKFDLNQLNQVREKLTQELNETLERRFPKEKRDQLKEKVITNILETRTEVENRARVIANKSKESPIVVKYLRPMVGSEKTTEVLSTLETRVTKAAPVVRKLQTLRQQFLDLTAPVTTAPQTEETVDASEAAPKKRKSKTAKAEQSQDA